MASGGLLRRAVRPLAFIAAYVLAARLTQGLTLESGYTPWYLPAGLTLAYLIAVGPGGAFTVFAARLINAAILVPEAWRDEPEGVLVRAVAITACYTLGAYVLRIHLSRVRLRQLGWFALVGVVAVPLGTAISVAAVSTLLLGESASDAFDAARTVWIGDAVSIATFVPAALLWLAAWRGQVRPARVPVTRADRIEVGLQALALVTVPVLALVIADRREAPGFLCLAVVPVVWVAVRNSLLLGAIGLLVVNTTLTVVAGAWLGDGTRMSEQLQAAMLVSAVAALYVSVATHTHKVAMSDLAASEDRYRSLVENLPTLVVRFDQHGAVRFASTPTWLEPSLRVEDVVAPLQGEWSSLVGSAGAELPKDHDWEVVAPSGEVRWFTARLGLESGRWGKPAAVVAVITDLTPERHVEAELDRARWRDPLTGLVNRQRFLDLLGPMSAVPDGQELGVAIVDIDNFKTINETLGYAGADRVLVEIGGRLRERVGGAGFAARLAGDEFAVTVPVAGAEDVAALGQLLVRDLRVRVPLDDRDLFITCSVGVAHGNGDRDATSVFYDAESALNAAKETGRDRAASFEAGHRVAAVERARRLALVQQALERQEVVVHYQPIVHLESREAMGVEALVRLPDAQGGILLPGAFIDLVEEAGLDDDLGALVLEQALRDLARWPTTTRHGRLTMSVNITARQLTQPGFGHRVLAACTRNGIAPDRLRLELTESMVMEDLDEAVRALEELRSFGVTAALDDFGTGYSSMSYLQQLPVDVLKIDRSFVAGLPHDDDDRSIVGLVLGLANALGLEVTAEGIESEAQRVALLEMGCQCGQGFLFDRPIAASEIAARLTAVVAGTA